MSSKLVSRESPAGAQPMAWTTVRGAAPALFPPANTADGDPRSATADQRMEANLQAIEAQAQRRVQEAREAGRREGEAAGREAARAELQPVLERLAAAVREAAGLRPGLRAQAEADLVKLAIAIARRILNRELATDPEAIAGLARVGLDKVRAQELIRVRVHPDHLEPIRGALARLGAGGVEVAADPVLERGGVAFETARGRLDVSVESQLREIDRGLADRLGATL